MLRITRILLIVTIAIVTVAIGASATAASAASTSTLDRRLAALWTKVFETPSAQNPFGSGSPASECIDIGGHTIAPFGPPPGVGACTVNPGTSLFVIGQSVECSTFEGNGTTDAALRACARAADATVAPTIVVDGHNVPVTQVETPLLHIILPADNIFGLPAITRGLSVGHGWVTRLNPLTPGTHSIVIGGTITTTISVQPCPAHN